MEKIKFKAWITKYALTEGIHEQTGHVSKNSPSMFCSETDSGLGNMYFHREGRDWHRTKESALKRAEAMRLKKIASLRKSIQKLEAISFDANNLGV